MSFGQQPPILRKDSTDTEFTTWKIILIAFMSIMNIFMFLGNLLSILTISSTQSLRKQVSYWFVLNLAIIDLTISLTVVPMNIMWEYHGIWKFSKNACDFFTFADIAFSTISAYSIVLVSIDKYMYISYSIHYYDRMTRKITLILIISVWIMVFTFSTISVFTEIGTSEEYRDHYIALSNGTRTCIFVMTDTFVIPSAIFCFFIPFIILCFTSSKIVCIASKHIRKIHTISNCATSESDSETIRSLKQATKARSNTFPSPFKQRKVSTTPCQKCVSNSLHNTISTPNILLESPSILKKHACLPVLSDLRDKASQSSSEHNSVSCQTTCKTVEPEEKENDVQQTIDKNMANEQNKPSENEKDIQHTKDKIMANKQNKPSDNGCQSVQKLECDDCKSLTKLKLGKRDSNYQLQKTDSLKTVVKIRKRASYCKLFGTITIVIACFVVMFAPYYIATIVDVWCHCLQAWIYEDILAVMYYMHSLVNPYIYMATDRKYKAALKILLERICKNIKT